MLPPPTTAAPTIITQGGEPRPSEDCLRAWDDGTVAPIECEDFPEAFRAVTADAPNGLSGRSFVMAAVVLDGAPQPAAADGQLRISFEADTFEAQTPCSPVAGRFEVSVDTLYVWALSVGGIDDCNEASFAQMAGVQGLLTDLPTVRVTDDTLVLQRDDDRLEATEPG